MPNKIKQFRPKGIKARAVDNRPTSAERGYNTRWQRFRKQVLRDWVQRHGPYCADCRGVLDFGRGTHVDHIHGHDGQNDPKFWDHGNLQVLCGECHGRKTRKEAAANGGGGGVSIPARKNSKTV